jgi:CheY-like chemotaxis protein
LSSVYGIVKQSGGFIHAYSEPGNGSSFKVYFPAVEAPPDVVPGKRREEAARGGTETILLAEDAESLRALAERILTGLGYTVLVARDGEEAVEVMDRNVNVDLAVLDLVMPRKGGKEAYEEMRRKNPNLKVLFMSGYSADVGHESFVLTPGTPFLPKPYTPSSLARKVREVLDRK